MTSSQNSKSKSAIRGLGEIALRVNDLDQMQRFYADVIGLPLMQRFETSAFFKIAEGVGGHTQILALFDRSAQSNYQIPDAGQTTVDHFAFAIAADDFDSELERLKLYGVPIETAEHAWVKWRSMYVRDPEGNTVELVCFDDTIG